MKTGIISILLAVILALIPCLSALAQDSTGEVTITMDTKSVVGIELDKTEWKLGDVASNTEKVTSPAATWCTITNAGNANVNIHIKGDDAQWVGHPVNTYKWTLSDTNVSDPSDPNSHKYVLWYHIANDDAGSYSLITTTETEMKRIKNGSISTLNLSAHNDYAQFGLKLLTPTYFYGGRQMETHIAISAVAA